MSPIVDYKAVIMLENKSLLIKKYVQDIKTQKILAKLHGLLCAWLTVTNKKCFLNCKPNELHIP